MARNAVDEVSGHLRQQRYVLHDRDTKFCAAFDELFGRSSFRPTWQCWPELYAVVPYGAAQGLLALTARMPIQISATCRTVANVRLANAPEMRS